MYAPLKGERVKVDKGCLTLLKGDSNRTLEKTSDTLKSFNYEYYARMLSIMLKMLKQYKHFKTLFLQMWHLHSFKANLRRKKVQASTRNARHGKEKNGGMLQVYGLKV